MMFRIDGGYAMVWPDSFYGGKHEGGVFDYLYRLRDGRWFLHSLNTRTLSEPTFAEISERVAISWLIQSRGVEEAWATELPRRRSAQIAPLWVVDRDELSQCGQIQSFYPPPIGPQVWIELPKVSRTRDALTQRQSQFLEPGLVLENIMWPAMADSALTARFQQERHDPLVARLQRLLEATLLERPRLSILQSLQDRGCDLLIEWPLRAKYGVQLKSNRDVEEKEFASHTLMQIQDSRQHGLKRLYVVFAADITGNSNSQKVRGLESRISAMNDPYVVVVPPERAWTLLFGI